MGLFVSEIGEQLQGSSDKSLLGGERGSYYWISQLPSCWAMVAQVWPLVDRRLLFFGPFDRHERM
jgi:hypothetical protein